MAYIKLGVSKKQSTPNVPKNKHFLPPDKHAYVCVSGSKKCSFYGKFAALCFLGASVLRFTLLPYYRQIEELQELHSQSLRVLIRSLNQQKSIQCFLRQSWVYLILSNNIGMNDM